MLYGQTLAGTATSNSATLTVNTIPAAPGVSVTNNCGSSLLTATGAPGATFSWSNGATTSSITVTTAGTYTVTQTVNGCSSPAASGVAAPKPIPALSSNLTATATSGTAFTYTATSSTPGTTFAWSRAAVTGISNAAANGNGNINETLVNTTASPVNVTYVYTLTANGCTNTQNVVVTVGVDGSIVAPAVTTQPAAQTRCAGVNASFSSAASGSPAPTVQWQESTNGTTWNNITGATASTLSFATTTADNNKQYRAVWTNIAGTATSNSATLTVNSIFQWGEVDLQNLRLVLADSKTGKSVRPLATAAAALLASLPRADGSPWVFPAERGDGPFAGLQAAWERIVAASGLRDVSLHTLRHTVGSSAVSSGESLPLTGGILGHASQSSTSIYAHLQRDPVQRAADRAINPIAAALEGSPRRRGRGADGDGRLSRKQTAPGS